MGEITNYTGDGKQKSLAHLFCSAELTGGIHSQLIFLSVLNMFLSIASFLGNTLILVALSKETSLHPPSKLLLRSLAATDICVGIISQPLHVTQWFSAVYERWDICRSMFATFVITGRTLCLVSLLTLTAISVDRLFALLLGLRYRQVVTLKRTYGTVFTFWVSSFVGSTIFVWNDSLSTWYFHIVIMLCLAIGILLHQDFPQAASSSNSSSRQCYRTTEPNNSTKHGAIQKDSVQCTVAAVDISCLLFAIYCSSAFGS